MPVAGNNFMEISGDVADAYQQRDPRSSDYFRCIEAHFEQIQMIRDDCYASRYGFWRPYVSMAIIFDPSLGYFRIPAGTCFPY